MPFQKGNQYGKTSKRGYNKETKEIREKVQQLIEGIIDTIDISYMNTNAKLKLLNILLNYSLPKLRTEQNTQGADIHKVMNTPKVVVFHNRQDREAYDEMSEEEREKYELESA